MASASLQILGIILTLLGWVNALVSCALPLWKVTAFIGNNIVVAQVVWEGLWMSWVVQSTGQMQYKVYDSLLALPQDLQAARALCVITLLVALLSLLVYLAGPSAPHVWRTRTPRPIWCSPLESSLSSQGS
ncbi:hypothetical protein MC885_012871 [Smutsia gigantea]|nr:hypothetical protein MC885_012871 [Smutsia gigantea]